MKEIKRVHLNLKPEIFEYLSKIREDTGISVNSLIVLALIEFLGKSQEPDWWKPWANKFIENHQQD